MVSSKRRARTKGLTGSNVRKTTKTPLSKLQALHTWN
jgi:hypothetical protein